MNKHVNTHQAFASGRFFSGDMAVRDRQVQSFLKDGLRTTRLRQTPPRAIVAPHAGFRFSGALAGRAYAQLNKQSYAQVVVISPSHHHAFAGIAMPSWHVVEIPGHRTRLDRRLRDDLVRDGLAIVDDAAFDREHGIDTQLPFLRFMASRGPVLPIVVGQCKITELAKLIDEIDARVEGEVLFILSSDLSHFHDLPTAQALDQETAKAIELGDLAMLNSKHACGWRPLAGFLASKIGAGCKPVRLGLGDSSPVNGDETRVVGYGAWGFYPPSADVLGPALRRDALRVAREVLNYQLDRGKPPVIDTGSFAPALQGYGASFVTLTQNDRLRGCIGSLRPHSPLINDIAANVVKAGLKDPRFKPVPDRAAFEALKIKIAVLTRPTPMHFRSEGDILAQMRPGKTGMILRDQGHTGTFLPMVWDSLTTPQQFWEGLKVKAGLPKTHWSATLRVEHYQTESFAE